MHGYSQKVPEGYRAWKPVVEDRLQATLEAAKFFKDLGCEVEIVISGGTEYEGRKEADVIYEYAESKHPEIRGYDVTLKKESQRTAENIEEILEEAKKENAKAVVPTSSKDHISRVMRDFVYHPNRPEDTLILGNPSKEPYSEVGFEIPPAIVEPPVKFGDINLAEIIPKFFRVPSENRGEFAEEVKAILEKYGVY